MIVISTICHQLNTNKSNNICQEEGFDIEYNKYFFINKNLYRIKYYLMNKLINCYSYRMNNLNLLHSK